MSEKLDKAILFATKAHANQVRKFRSIPYILHPLEVAAIVSSMTNNEEVMIAGLLHDVVEDAGITPEQIYNEFGARVAELVATETEDKRAELPPVDTWKIRKEESLEDLRKSDDVEVKMLWLGDKLANIRSFYRDYLESGDEMFSRFNQTDKNEQKWYYTTIAEYTSELKDTTAHVEYCSLLNKIFG